MRENSKRKLHKLIQALELVKTGKRQSRSYSKETVVVRSRLSEESRARPVLPFQQAAPDGYDQSRGWTAGQAGSLMEFWLRFR